MLHDESREKTSKNTILGHAPPLGTRHYPRVNIKFMDRNETDNRTDPR